MTAGNGVNDGTGNSRLRRLAARWKAWRHRSLLRQTQLSEAFRREQVGAESRDGGAAMSLRKK